MSEKKTNVIGWHDGEILHMLYSHSKEEKATRCNRCGRLDGDVMVAMPAEKYIGYNRIRRRRERKWTVRVSKKGLCKQCKKDIAEAKP